MKDYYLINEISKLYGIGPDSLRYYEKIGIISPERSESGYRLYSLKDIYKLSIISDLRRLDFTMKQIKEYLDYQSVANTLELLREESAIIKEQVQSLIATELSINKRMRRITELSQIATGEFRESFIPERKCLQLRTRITKDEETDLAIQKLQRKHEDKIQAFGTQTIGAIPSMEAFRKGNYGVFSSVFFVLEEDTKFFDFSIPEGRYISLFYRGSYDQSPQKINAVFDFAEAKNFQLAGEPLELYHIDNRHTVVEKEFLTEIQVNVIDKE